MGNYFNSLILILKHTSKLENKTVLTFKGQHMHTIY